MESFFSSNKWNVGKFGNVARVGVRTRENVVRGSREVGDVRKCLKESIEDGG